MLGSGSLYVPVMGSRIQPTLGGRGGGGDSMAKNWESGSSRPWEGGGGGEFKNGDEPFRKQGCEWRQRCNNLKSDLRSEIDCYSCTGCTHAHTFRRS